MYDFTQSVSDRYSQWPVNRKWWPIAPTTAQADVYRFDDPPHDLIARHAPKIFEWNHPLVPFDYVVPHGTFGAIVSVRMAEVIRKFDSDQHFMEPMECRYPDPACPGGQMYFFVPKQRDCVDIEQSKLTYHPPRDGLPEVFMPSLADDRTAIRMSAVGGLNFLSSGGRVPGMRLVSNAAVDAMRDWDEWRGFELVRCREL